MNDRYHLQIGRRGVITLPKELRNKNNIGEGEIFHVLDLGDGVFVFSRRSSRVDEIADKLAREWGDSGESLETMLTALCEVRLEHDTEKRA